MKYIADGIRGEVTYKHPELKEGVRVKEATNPEGMFIANAHWVMDKANILYYESAFLKTHIEQGYIKEIYD